MSKEIYYSDKYEDDKYEYRHVMLPKVGFFFCSDLSNLISVLGSPSPSWCPRRTACLNRSGETLGFSRALGKH